MYDYYHSIPNLTLHFLFLLCTAQAAQMAAATSLPTAQTAQLAGGAGATNPLTLSGLAGLGGGLPSLPQPPPLVAPTSTGSASASFPNSSTASQRLASFPVCITQPLL